MNSIGIGGTSGTGGSSGEPARPSTQSRDNQKLTFGQHAWIIGACMKTYQHTNAQVGIPGKYAFQKGGIRYTDPSNPNALAALIPCSPRFRLACNHHHTIGRVTSFPSF